MRNLAAVLLLASVSMAGAQGGMCAPHDQVVSLLSKNHKEERQAIGLTAGGQLLEIFVSQAGTWTAVISSPAGQSCITAAGEAWKDDRPVIPGEDM
jgi:hypothetical protein